MGLSKESEFMKKFSLKLRDYIYFFILPLLVGIYPALFHYSNNSKVVLIDSLIYLLILFIGISIFVFIIFLFIYKNHSQKAAIAASIFLVFFHTYGIVFNKLQQWDIYTIEHYMILPVYVVLALYLIWFVGRINHRLLGDIWKIITIIMLGLVLINVIQILPIEIKKNTRNNNQIISANPNQIQETEQTYPDIYYIIFDEMAGFDAIRKYWQYNQIDNFIAALRSQGFFIAENSHGSTTNTFHEIANRLNYEYYPYDPSDYKKYNDEDLDHISDNTVFSFLKSKGYSIVVFDDGLPLTTRWKADLIYSSSLNETLSGLSLYNEFAMLVLNNTMFEPFMGYFEQATIKISNHERMIYLIANKITQLGVQSPKLVFVHLLMPHMPFLFNANGKSVPLENQNDWDRYLGYYIFSTHYAQSLIKEIISSTSHDHPPIVIFQSDHGARNIKTENNNILLQNYPSEYGTLIVNTLYLPGCNDVPLTQNMDPINTFPIIFNCYFNANIPLK